MGDPHVGRVPDPLLAIQSSMASITAMDRAPFREPSRSMMACLNRLSSSSGSWTLILTVITHLYLYSNTPLRLYIHPPFRVVRSKGVGA